MNLVIRDEVLDSKPWFHMCRACGRHWESGKRGEVCQCEDKKEKEYEKK